MPSEGNESPVPKVNGTSGDKAKNKKDRRKDSKPDSAAATTPETASTPAPVDSTSTPAKTDAPLPASESASTAPGAGLDSSSTGARTPKTNKPPRNPHTLFMRFSATLLPGPNEADIRTFFGSAAAGITKVNLPHPFGGKPRLAYVEFGDEESLKKALEGHETTLGGTTPEVKLAVEREQRQGGATGEGGQQGFGGRGFGGRGRGRGGGGGGFAARGLSAAGLTRGRGGGNAGGGGANGDANGHA